MTNTERSVAERIEAALASVDSTERITIAAVCRQAGVSRTALYRFHPDALRRVRALQQTEPLNVTDAATIRDLRAALARLRSLSRHLTALVDHYAAAYREAQELVARRDRELAELRRSRRSSPTALRRTGLTAVPTRPSTRIPVPSQ